MPFGYEPHDCNRIINQIKDEPFKKVFLEVKALCKITGQMVPLSFKWADKEYNIDRVISCQNGQSLKLGYKGYRYNCQCGDKSFYLFYISEPCNKWYVEINNYYY